MVNIDPNGAMAKSAQLALAGALVGFGTLAILGTCICLVWVPGLLVVRGLVNACADWDTHPSVVILNGISLIAPALGGIWLLAVAALRNLRTAALYAVLNWVLQVWRCLASQALCDQGSFLPWAAPQALPHGVTVLLVLVAVVPLIILEMRLSGLESVSFECFGVWRLHWMWLLVLPLVVLMGVAFFMASQALAAVTFVCIEAWYCVFCGLIWISLARARRTLEVAAARSPPRKGAQANKATMALRIQACGAALALYSTFLTTTYEAFGWWKSLAPWIAFFGADARGRSVALHLLTCFDGLCNVLFALALSGALSGALCGTAARARAEVRRSRRAAAAAWFATGSRRAGSCTGKGTVEEASEAAWDLKVQELAGRGVTLSAVLDFYQSLDEHMVPFDSSRHTTREVVQQAVMPLTAPQGCALSDILMQGRYTLPDRTVTHNWDSLFRDLVASICADALGEPEVENVAEMLELNMALLQRWLAGRGVLGNTYWVSALSVNHHLSLCDDSCPCFLPKARNDTPPLLADGRSVPCEMNKFSDMLSYLAAGCPGFAQVVAIDADCKIFTRTWCVAEVVEAHKVGVALLIKMYSSESLAKLQDQARSIRIQDTEATRPEDKEEILSTVGDADNINVIITKLLLKELIPAWNSLDGQEQMTLAGCLIRWYQTQLWEA